MAEVTCRGESAAATGLISSSDLVTKNAGQAAWFNILWAAVRQAVIAGDPNYHGDVTAFCDSYAKGEYVPDLL